MRRVCWIYCCFLIVAAATTVQAKTFFVDPTQSIQDAIDEAAETPGPDTIHIASGDYEENLQINDPDKLTLAGSGASLVAADSGEHVIEIDGGNVTISDLEVTGGKDGINADDMISLTVRNVVVTGNGDEGLQAKDMISLTVRNVVATGNDDKGLSAEDVDSVKITNCTFSENEGDGVKLEGVDTAEINGITLLGNDDGIDIEVSGDIHVTQLTASGNGDEGFEVDDTDSVVIVGGTVSDNDDDGLDLDDTQYIRLVSVVSTGNAGNGLQIEAEEDFDTEAVTVVHSVFSDNGEDGIKIVEEDAVVHKVSLRNVTARTNVESGLDIAVSGSISLARIISGLLEGNGEADILP